MKLLKQHLSEVSDMLNSYYNEKMLGLQEVKVKNIRENENSFEIEVEQARKASVCPCCGEKTDMQLHISLSFHQIFLHQLLTKSPYFDLRFINASIIENVR